MEPSNCIVVGGESVLAPEDLLNLGISVRNFQDDGLLRFQSKGRKLKLRHLVIHESAGGVDGYRTVARLDKKGLGVHLVVHPNGDVSCHADLLDDRLVHCGQINRSSIGLEVINPYAPSRAKPPFGAEIPADWWTWVPKGGRRAYLTPTNEQMRTIMLLVPWVCDLCPDLPLKFPTRHLCRQQRRIGAWNAPKPAKPDPGVVAHRDFAGHADGRWILERLIERYE